MKTKIIVLIAATLLLSGQIVAQTTALKVTSNKVKYTRKGNDIPEHKKNFEVNYPVVSGTKTYQVEKNLRQTISYWNNFGMTLEENFSDTWLYALDYKVNYNKGGILDLSLFMEGSGAYPSSSNKNLVIDTKTGKRVYIKDVFRNIGKLLVKIEKAQKLAIAESAKEDEITLQELKDEIKRSSSYTLEEFSISDSGVTFIFDYGFPHAIKAMEPDGRYFFTWSQMRSHIKRDGLLGKFVS